MADLNKDPFQKDGTLVLPINPIQDYRKFGLNLAKDVQGSGGGGGSSAT